jgi:hypothetical protein
MTKREHNVESDQENSVKKLRKLRRKFKTGASDYRGLVRETMANAMEVVLKLRSNKLALQRFLELAKIKPVVAHDK